MADTISIAQIKAHLSEFIARSNYNHDRIVITKRNKPVAALVPIDDLKYLESRDEKKGLAQVIGKWEDFSEIEDFIDDIFRSRSEEDDLRDVSF